MCDAGAAGYVLRETSARQLPAAIRRVGGGRGGLVPPARAEDASTALRPSAASPARSASSAGASAGMMHLTRHTVLVVARVGSLLMIAGL